MKNFKIAQPQTVDQVTSLLFEKKEKYALIAGGVDLLDIMRNEIDEPEVVVDLRSIPNLSYIKKEKDRVRIGILTSVSELAENSLIKENYSGLHEAANSVATPQLRNMCTVGGNLCHRPHCWYFRDPQVVCRKKGGSKCYAFRGRNRYHAILGGGICYVVHPSDLAPALISLNTEISISSPNGDKIVPLEDFYTLPSLNVRKENILEPDEVVKEIKIPLAKTGERSTYYKFRERGAWDFAVVSAALKAKVTGDVFRDVRIVLGGVAPVPWRLKKAEKIIKGNKVTEDLVRQAAREALKEARALEENEYKEELVEVVLYRAALDLLQD